MSDRNVTNNNLVYTTNNTYHVNGDEVGVQIGNGNSFQQRYQLQEEVVDLREEVGELKDRVRQLEERMTALENNNKDTHTEEQEYQMDGEAEDLVSLKMYNLYYMSVSRDKTVRGVEQILDEEYRKVYGREFPIFVDSIYSVKQEKDIYNLHNNVDLPLSHYGVDNGDVVHCV